MRLCAAKAATANCNRGAAGTRCHLGGLPRSARGRSPGSKRAGIGARSRSSRSQGSSSNHRRAGSLTATRSASQDVSAAAALGPVLHHLIHRVTGQKLSAVPSCPGCAPDRGERPFLDPDGPFCLADRLTAVATSTTSSCADPLTSLNFSASVRTAPSGKRPAVLHWRSVSGDYRVPTQPPRMALLSTSVPWPADVRANRDKAACAARCTCSPDGRLH
jgi:hypothetical protein